jgi:hypothetical protein
MTIDTTRAPDAEADIRWRDWQARGAAGDRRREVRMGGLTLLIALGLGIWLFVQLV